MDQETKAAFTQLTKTVHDGFASLEERMEKGFAAVAQDIADIREQMITKGELPELIRPILCEELQPIEDRLTSVESKISGTNRRLDEDAMLRTDLALPARIADLEEKTFGASRHPKHVPLK